MTIVFWQSFRLKSEGDWTNWHYIRADLSGTSVRENYPRKCWVSYFWYSQSKKKKNKYLQYMFIIYRIVLLMSWDSISCIFFQVILSEFQGRKVIIICVRSRFFGLFCPSPFIKCLSIHVTFKELRTEPFFQSTRIKENSLVPLCQWHRFWGDVGYVLPDSVRSPNQSLSNT